MTTDYIGICTPPQADCEIVISKQPTCETPSTKQTEVPFIPFHMFGLLTPSEPIYILPPLVFPPLPPLLPPGNPGWPSIPEIPIIPEYPEPLEPPSQVVPEPSSILTFVAILAVGIIYVYKRR